MSINVLTCKIIFKKLQISICAFCITRICICISVEVIMLLLTVEQPEQRVKLKIFLLRSVYVEKSLC